MNHALIIVPTYNERDNLPRVAQKLLSLPVAVDLLVMHNRNPFLTMRLRSADLPTFGRPTMAMRFDTFAG